MDPMEEPGLCNARTRTGGRCRQLALDNGRCHWHGGKSTGPPPGSRNAMKHGAYAKVLKNGDKRRFNQLKEELGKLDSEITLARWQLEKVLEQEQKWLEKHPDGEGLEQVEEVREEGLENVARMENEDEFGDYEPPPGLNADIEKRVTEKIQEGMDLEQTSETSAGKFPGRTITLRKPDFFGQKTRLLDLIGRLEEKRAKLLEHGELKDLLEDLQQELADIKEGGSEEKEAEEEQNAGD